MGTDSKALSYAYTLIDVPQIGDLTNEVKPKARTQSAW